MIHPPSLRKGDRVAIISPATKVREEYVRGAAEVLAERGYEPHIMPGALGPASGSFASSREQRLADLRCALLDDSVKAILCARGGYGCVHLIPEIACREVAENPKWMIGFSDVSALHALWYRSGVVSLHAPMAKHLTTESSGNTATSYLFDILENGARVSYEVPAHHFNRRGEARGIIRGGNLAVLNGLAATRYDILHVSDDEDVILFIEDISEAVYAVERMLTRLCLSGTLGRLRGLIIGQFTEYHEDLNYPDMESMIDALLTRFRIDGIPVAFNFPVGHVADNYPIPEGSQATLCVGKECVTLKME